MTEITFIALDVRPRAQRDMAWDILFSAEDSDANTAAVAMLTLLRGKRLEITVKEISL